MNNIRRILLALLVGLLTAGQAWAQSGARTHEVQMGETLYSLGRRYGVTVDAIRQANPRMGEVLMAGQVINIPAATTEPAAATPTPVPASAPAANAANQPTPQPAPQPKADDKPAGNGRPECRETYVVAKKETVYSISRRFGLTEDELRRANPQIVKNKVKKGETLCIPYSAADLAIRRQQEELRRVQAEAERQRVEEEERKKAQMFSRIGVAVILPFNLDNQVKGKEAVKMIDFYEGFLLAVDELRQRGIAIDVHAFEEKGTSRVGIDSILSLPAMQSVQLIVGPMRVEHIPAVSAFGTKHNIPVAVPFSTKASITTLAPTTFQVNTLVSTLYQSVYDQFAQRNPKAKVLFVNTADKNERPDFIAGFKQALKDRSIEFETVEPSALADMKKLIGESSKPHILVPSSNSQAALEQVVRVLNTTADNAQQNISLFGYPEWQTFSEKNRQNIAKYHGSFFATFYTNLNSTDVKDFNSRFLRWFKRDQYKARPLYGLLGYDVANYFIPSIKKYGRAFIDRQADIKASALQNPMRFERSNTDNGFINTHVRIITM